ncbi:MAG: penicillin-binding protein 2 [Elusimicrobia bacterium]|nr:penicillin-binding protein 2 [Elusimicrobiota bacterium]
MKITRVRIITVFVSTLLVFLVIGFRLFQIQIVDYKFFNQKVAEQSKRVKKYQPLRGNIYDRKMRVLATSMVSSSCYIDLKKAEDLDINLFAKCIGLSSEEVNAKIKQKKNVALIKRKLLPEEVLKIRSRNFPGVYFEEEQLRFYPENSLANYVVGVVGTDNNGLSGVEYTFDDFLVGKSTKYVINRDGRGREVIFNSKPAESVRAVVLTIDNRIQHVVEQELKKAYADSSARLLTCIIQNPQTGEILAMASYPSYDSNKKIDSKMLKNPAIGDTFEPGSVFKIVPVAAALETQPDITKEKIFCENGSFKLAKNVTIHDHEKYGILSFEEMFAYSSNIGFAKLAHQIGKQNLWQYARSFGFGMATGVELTGEINGILLPPNKWSKISCEIISFGQEISATALQIVNAFSVIANGGVLMEPKIVRSILYDNNEKQVFEPTTIRRVVSQKTADIMKGMLESVVNYGTGVQAKISGIKVAGKTGTAQKYDKILKDYSKTKYVSLFAGFLPSDDPKITILIVLDEPKENYWASSVAAPVFKRIALGVLEYLNIEPTREVVMK